jgi:hypothetical protein
VGPVLYSSGFDALRDRVPEFGRTMDDNTRLDEGDFLPHMTVESVGPFVGDAASFIEGWPPALRREAEGQRDWRPGDPGPTSV